MNTEQIFNEAKFSRLIYEIERTIHVSDMAVSGGYEDSDIKSAIRTTLSVCKAKQATAFEVEWDRQDDAITSRLDSLYHSELEGEDTSRHDFMIALLSVEGSLLSRNAHHGYSRGYLDYLAQSMEAEIEVAA